MGGLFSKPKVTTPKAPDPLPPAPDRSSAEVQEAASKQRDKFYRSSGVANNVFAGGFGGSTSTTSSVVKLLGNAGR